MKLNEVKVGLCVTGSFCTINDNIHIVQDLKDKGVDISVIFSNSVSTSINKFSDPNKRYELYKNISEKNIIDTIEKAEPIGPNKPFDVLVVLPCTGNTLSKIANGVTDTPVTMSIKAHLRNNLPVVIGISSNDALGLLLKKIQVI